jgi:hypothetical protein
MIRSIKIVDHCQAREAQFTHFEWLVITGAVKEDQIRILRADSHKIKLLERSSPSYYGFKAREQRASRITSTTWRMAEILSWFAEVI